MVANYVDELSALNDIAGNVAAITDKIIPSSTGNTVSMQLSVRSTAPDRLLFSDPSRKEAMIRNIGSTDIYIGDSSVTVSSGFPLRLDDAVVLDDATGETWAIADDVGGIVAIISK